MIKAEDFKWLDRVYHLFHLGSYLCLSGALTDCFLPLHETCLQGFGQNKTQANLLSYRDLTRRLTQTEPPHYISLHCIGFPVYYVITTSIFESNACWKKTFSKKVEFEILEFSLLWDIVRALRDKK